MNAWKLAIVLFAVGSVRAEAQDAAQQQPPPQPAPQQPVGTLPADAPKMDAPVKPIPAEPTEAEKAMSRGEKDAKAEDATTAADWAKKQRVKAGLPVERADDQQAPVKPIPAEPSEAEKAMARGQQLTVGFGSPAENAPGGLASAAAPPAHVLEISGYAILNATITQSDPQQLYVGRRNGFTLGDARIEITARPADSLWLFLSIDGAYANPSGADPSQGTRDVKLKDAYGVWSPGGHWRLQAGQFKAPQSIEELLEETDIKFAYRSLLSTGVTAPYGYTADPLSVGRQLGVGVGSDRIPLFGGGLTTEVALMNGNGPDQLANDSSYPSAMGRVAYDLGGVSVGVWGAFQPRTKGTQPLVYRDNVFSAGADVLVQRGPLHALFLAEWTSTRHVTIGGIDEHGLGLSGELAWKFDWIEPAARVTLFDPSDLVQTDQVIWVTGGLNFYIPGAPGRFTINYTHRVEQSARELSNDGFDFLAQVRF